MNTQSFPGFAHSQKGYFMNFILLQFIETADKASRLTIACMFVSVTAMFLSLNPYLKAEEPPIEFHMRLDNSSNTPAAPNTYLVQFQSINPSTPSQS